MDGLVVKAGQYQPRDKDETGKSSSIEVGMPLHARWLDEVQPITLACRGGPPTLPVDVQAYPREPHGIEAGRLAHQVSALVVEQLLAHPAKRLFARAARAKSMGVQEVRAQFEITAGPVGMPLPSTLTDKPLVSMRCPYPPRVPWGS